MTFPTLPPTWRPFGNSFSIWLGRTALKLSGWRIEGKLPDTPKLIIAVAPHTSNWDFPLGVMTMFAINFKAGFLGKKSLFTGPLGPMMRWLGGVPVDRNAAQDMVEQIASEYRVRDTLVLAIAPEGTRKKVGRLKTGFIRIAAAAEVPILLASIDYSKKIILFGDVFTPTGDIEADHDSCYAYFKQFQGHNPDQY